MSFPIRLRSKASRHVLKAHMSPSSRVEQVIAVKLLNNANLDEGILTNAKYDLISLEKHRYFQEE